MRQQHTNDSKLWAAMLGEVSRPAAHMVESAVQNREWETSVGMPDPASA